MPPRSDPLRNGHESTVSLGRWRREFGAYPRTYQQDGALECNRRRCMCMNCSPHRHGTEHDHESTVVAGGTTHERAADSFLGTPISRGQLLKGLGGGLLTAVAAGSVGLQLTQSEADALPYVVLIVLDGARREYFNVPGTPHIQSLIRNGTQYTNAFAGILESETPSGHVAIGTGSEPSKTGIPSFWWA